MLFGGRQDTWDVHLGGLNFDFLGNFVAQRDSPTSGA
jgi:hypothetical protein